MLSTPPVNSYLLPPSPVNKVTPPRSVADIVPITFWFSSIVNVEAEVNTGATVSTTFTVLVSVAVFPEASEAV